MIKNVRPDSFQHLLELIDQEDFYIFAGGTDLMIRKRQWQGAERRFDKPIVYICHLQELHGIHEREGHYEIMTCVTQNQLAESVILPDYLKFPIGLMANPPIRNLATIGGNIVNDASVGDSIPIFFALDAELVLRSVHGTRQMKIQDFIKGKYRTDLKSNEILEKIIIPKEAYDGFYYRKTGLRKASILSKLSVYGLYKKEKGALKDIKIAVGAVNDTPIRSREAEERFIQDGNIDRLVESYRGLMEGKDDKRSTKAYREEVASRLINNYLREVL